MAPSASLKEQLTNILPNQQISRRAHVHPVSQVLLSLQNSDLDEAYINARSESLKWMAKRAGWDLPSVAFDGQSFELGEVGAQRAAAVALDEPVLWAARLDDADKNVPRRVWTTELGIARTEDAVLFGCRLMCATMGDNPSYLPSIPGIVRQVISTGNAVLDGRPVRDEAWRVNTEEDVDNFLALLGHPQRRRPIFVFSDNEDGERCAADANWLAANAIGACHVVTVSSPASYLLTRALGKVFSVFGGAVRTYRAGFDQDKDNPSSHPLALQHSIVNWPEGGAPKFCEFLLAQALRTSIGSRQQFEQELPSFTAIQNIARHKQREKAEAEVESDSELLKLAEEEVLGLRSQLEEERATSASLLEEADSDQKVLEEERDQARRELAAMRARIEYLESILSKNGGDQELVFPDSLDDLESWAQKFLAGSVVLHSRALRGANKSVFEDSQLVYQSLIVLRDYYVPMRRSTEGSSRKGLRRSTCTT
jgi:hypothetical protein